VLLQVLAATALVCGVLFTIVRDLFDDGDDGVKERYAFLLEHPFPAALTPHGYRVQGIEPLLKEVAIAAVAVYLTGPDDENSITFYAEGMDADGVYKYWHGESVDFARANGLTPNFLPAPGLGPRAYCEADHPPPEAQRRVSCVAAFDGLAVTAESINRDPDRGSLVHATTLLRAGVEYWESIRD
jgi:hypothetical protein